jgi:hypothetical protein
MLRDRLPLAYVTQIEDADIVLTIKEAHLGSVASHSQGITWVGRPGDLLCVDSGTVLIVLRIISLEFAEPKISNSPTLQTDPSRRLRSQVLGHIIRKDGVLEFCSEQSQIPPLGGIAFPLNSDEMTAVLRLPLDDSPQIVLGNEASSGTAQVAVPIKTLLPMHVAVLGATGQGKTHFVAATIQQLLKLPKSRIVIFDINGEYEDAFRGIEGLRFCHTVLGSPPHDQQVEGAKYRRIPYQALGRNGLFRLLLPSERAQSPALRFAIEHLHLVSADSQGARLLDQQENVLFDDCRNEGATEANEAMERIRRNGAEQAAIWPHMRALSCLAAEWYCLQRGNRGIERNSFSYGHVQSLVNRIRGLIEDDRFNEIIDVRGGPPVGSSELDYREESRALVEEIYGNKSLAEDDWKLHIVDLSHLSTDLMPFVLGALLELLSAELFKRGPGGTHPTMLVLEEAHHYLREIPGDTDGVPRALAYERLAREGRKFGLSLLVSTQRPSELSSTVLAQCGTWCVFRLTNELDQRSVAAAAEWGSGFILRQISSLSRGHAVVFGAAIPFPCRISVIRPNPEPRSSDSPFARAWC